MRQKRPGFRGCKSDGERRPVVKREGLNLGPKRRDTAASHAAAAGPVEDSAAAWLPAARREFRQHGIPLPPDPFTEGCIVKGQIIFRRPVVRRARGSIEKPLPE